VVAIVSIAMDVILQQRVDGYEKNVWQTALFDTTWGAGEAIAAAASHRTISVRKAFMATQTNIVGVDF
jgi:hypothetical protein